MGKPFDLTPQEKAACFEYGKLSGNIAVDRDGGVPLSQELATVRERFGASDRATEFTGLVIEVYKNPFFNKQTPESSAMSWSMDCEMRVGKHKAGAEYFNTSEEIAAGLADFKTFDGTPLVDLFGKYGIKISYVEAVPAEFFAPVPFEKGEVVYSMQFSHGASRTMPCHLRDWFKGAALPVPEFIRRGAEFPHVRPDDDAAIFWAATGNCSQAY